jgi:alpha-amylase
MDRLMLMAMRTLSTLGALGLLGVGGCGREPAGPLERGPLETRPSLPSTYRPTGHAAAGDVFVHLFEWPWADVAAECEEVLGPLGWRAVQVSPPQEHGITPGFPWHQRYQAVSYRLESRSGTEAEFRDMVQRCGAVGVDVYVDAIVNHMTGSGGTGSGGTIYTKYHYPGLYTSVDFHPPCEVNDYQNEANVQDCELFGLADLHTGQADVRERIAAYLIELGRMGVAGFRIDAAKHIQPVELDSILTLVSRAAAAEGRPTPYVFGEVIDYGGQEAVHASDYFGLGYASGGGSDLTEFRFRYTGESFAGVPGKTLAQLELFPGSWGVIPSDKAVVFIQNHDTQRDAASPVPDYGDGDAYRLANVWMLAQPYGHPKVMSSYAFNSRDLGPPSDQSGNTYPVACPLRMEDARPGDWVCEHRDPAIAAMVSFRRVVAGTTLMAWWDNGSNAVAFSRGDRGFVALNREAQTLALDVPTALPPGRYCDVLTGPPTAAGCSGRLVEVGEDGRIRLELGGDDAVAIHVEAASGWPALPAPRREAIRPRPDR